MPVPTAASLAGAIKEIAASATTRTARGVVVAVGSDGVVTFTVAGSTTPRKGMLLGGFTPAIGEVITYFDDGRGFVLVLGATGPRNVSIDATKSFIVGNTSMSNAGVVTTGTFVDATGSLRASIVSLQPTTWTSVSFTGGWSQYGDATYGSVAYRKVGDNVQLRGLAAGGTVGSATAIFTLPVGFRPPRHVAMATVSNNAFARVTAFSDGNVACDVGSNAWVSFDGLIFSVTS